MENNKQEPKRLYRSRTNKMLAGICGGVGEYFNVDPVPVRLAWMLITIFTGVLPGIIIYILSMFIIPERPVIEGAVKREEKTEEREKVEQD